jgi:predicted 3-demethylubiquinone-9 3-methyltransferase (glyoxalase superfamily)
LSQFQPAFVATNPTRRLKWSVALFKTQEMSEPIYPCLWFNEQAKEAADYYCGIFPQSRILEENAFVVQFELNGTRFMALNGRRDFDYTEAVSFVVTCANQEEIDHYWSNLTAYGGQESMCGWLKDKWGVSWQIVPSVLPRLISHPQNGQRVMDAFMKMKKFDIAELERAAAGK